MMTKYNIPFSFTKSSTYLILIVYNILGVFSLTPVLSFISSPLIKRSWTIHESCRNSSCTEFMNNTRTVHGWFLQNSSWTVHEVFLNTKWSYWWNYNIQEHFTNSILMKCIWTLNQYYRGIVHEHLMQFIDNWATIHLYLKGVSSLTSLHCL